MNYQIGDHVRIGPVGWLVAKGLLYDAIIPDEVYTVEDVDDNKVKFKHIYGWHDPDIILGPDFQWGEEIEYYGNESEWIWGKFIAYFPRIKEVQVAIELPDGSGYICRTKFRKIRNKNEQASLRNASALDLLGELKRRATDGTI